MKSGEKINGNNKRILFVGYGIYPPRNEAVSKNVKLLTAFLQKVGYRCYNYSFSEKTPFWLHLLLIPYHFFRIQKIIRKFSINVIHDEFVFPISSLIFVLPIKIFFPKVVFLKEIHNPPGLHRFVGLESGLRMLFFNRIISSLVIKFYDKILVRNPYLAKRINSNVFYLPPLIAVYRAKRKDVMKGEKRKHLFRLCYLGHPLRKKGLDIIIEFIRLLPRKYVKKIVFNFALSRIGKRNYYKDRLKEVAKRKKIKLKIKGEVKPHIFFRENDILLLPLLDEYSATAFPNTILEAMEGGCLVVTTRTPVNETVLKDKKVCFLVKSPNPRFFLNTVADIMDRWESYQEVKKRARFFVIKNFSLLSSKLLEKIYE